MARMKNLVIGALNVKTIPHSSERYVELFEKTFRAAGFAKIRGADWGTIGSLYPLNREKPLDGFIGILFRFLNIDPKEPWFNVRKRERIEVGDNEVLLVPDYLKPNLREGHFLFFPRGHRFLFDTDFFSPNGVVRLLKGLFADPKIEKLFGVPDVIIETDTDALDIIRSMPKLSKLDIFLTRPNPDELSKEKQRILDRANGQQAKNVQQIMTSPTGSGLLPDKETNAMMELAQSDGYVNAIGYDNERKRIEVSTRSYPVKHRTLYDPSVEGYQDVFVREGHALKDWLVKRNR